MLRGAASRTLRLTNAVESRIIVEQDKGITAEHRHVDLDEAFGLLRACARSRKQGITSVAAAIVAGTLTIDDLVAKQLA